MKDEEFIPGGEEMLQNVCVFQLFGHIAQDPKHETAGTFDAEFLEFILSFRKLGGGRCKRIRSHSLSFFKKKMIQGPNKIKDADTFLPKCVLVTRILVNIILSTHTILLKQDGGL